MADFNNAVFAVDMNSLNHLEIKGFACTASLLLNAAHGPDHQGKDSQYRGQSKQRLKNHRDQAGFHHLRSGETVDAGGSRDDFSDAYTEVAAC